MDFKADILAAKDSNISLFVWDDLKSSTSSTLYQCWVVIEENLTIESH